MPRKLPEPKEPAPRGDVGRFSYEGLDRVIHEKARLGLMTSLAASPDGLTFTELKDLCGLTDGNLNRHLKVLCEAGLVELWRKGAGRTQTTLARLTTAGRDDFLRYLGVLERVVRDASESAAGFAAKPLRAGWSPA